ncbi:MAG TPA: glycosyltransferase [Acidimicrobiales bacterium]|nr:glycosyltransferase [Acidimicrobiales bacterium]
MKREVISARTLAVGVVMPVHNEQELLGKALASLSNAFGELNHGSLLLRAVLVMDACTDDSEEIAIEWRTALARCRHPLAVTLVTSSAHNVGRARALGCAVLLKQWTRIDPARIWLATTDADSRVPKDWLTTQLARHEAGVDQWCGRVSVADWSEYSGDARSRWQHEYERESRPIHGANLGFNAGTYLAAGGFEPLDTGEDRALHRALVIHGALSHFDSAVRVVTSARRQARAPLGFAHALDGIRSAPGSCAQVWAEDVPL